MPFIEWIFESSPRYSSAVCPDTGSSENSVTSNAIVFVASTFSV
ncbi:hypothetical protein OV079_52860 [Nannocystis pusilla]|uniref:Uncharacterized protein n=1 Tax=Nannocystis pusilla TaxID=889268 RepID=A0A9X3F112_9BACT|nr:hypothetical protein [Nannocystis pusilla]MCY1014072.1 hypothetical protein [Nannocystis pusilla]